MSRFPVKVNLSRFMYPASLQRLSHRRRIPVARWWKTCLTLPALLTCVVRRLPPVPMTVSGLIQSAELSVDALRMTFGKVRWHLRPTGTMQWPPCIAIRVLRKHPRHLPPRRIPPMQCPARCLNLMTWSCRCTSLGEVPLWTRWPPLKIRVNERVSREKLLTILVLLVSRGQLVFCLVKKEWTLLQRRRPP